MRAVVGGQRNLFDGPALAIRQILRLEPVEKLQHARQALLMIDILDCRVIARRIGRHVVSERHGDIDELPWHGHFLKTDRSVLTHLEGAAPAASSNAPVRGLSEKTVPPPIAFSGRRQVDRCNSSIDRCWIWLGLRMPSALGTTLATSPPCSASHRTGRSSRQNLKAATNSGRAQNQRNVHGYNEHRHLASGIGRRRGGIAGDRYLPRSSRLGWRDEVALSGAEIINQPNPLDSVTQSYQGRL